MTVFMVLSTITILAALGVVLFSSPVRSALCLVFNFFTLAFIYFGLKTELLGITQIVVYTGAIMVLFLFVIMLLNLGGPQTWKERFEFRTVLGFGFGFALAAVIASQVFANFQYFDKPQAPDSFGSPQALGRVLFTHYVWPFEIASILLLIGIVGSIMLAKRKL